MNRTPAEITADRKARRIRRNSIKNRKGSVPSRKVRERSAIRAAVADRVRIYTGTGDLVIPRSAFVPGKMQVAKRIFRKWARIAGGKYPDRFVPETWQEK